jgi:hypothetical protein
MQGLQIMFPPSPERRGAIRHNPRFANETGESIFQASREANRSAMQSLERWPLRRRAGLTAIRNRLARRIADRKKIRHLGESDLAFQRRPAATPLVAPRALM